MIQTLNQSQGNSRRALTRPIKAKEALIPLKILLEGEGMEGKGTEINILLKTQVDLEEGEEEEEEETREITLTQVLPNKTLILPNKTFILPEIKTQSQGTTTLTFQISCAGCTTWTWSANSEKSATGSITT